MKKKISIIVIVLLLSSCKPTKEIIPAPKYIPSSYSEASTNNDTFMGLNISNYQSSIDTSFNYLEDAIEVFGTFN